jgi:hypothetical protein
MRRNLVWVTNSLLAVLLICAASLPALGQAAKLQLAHLEKLSSKADDVVDVTLDGTLLRLASKFLSEDRGSEESLAKDLIQNLQGIYVKSFEFDREGGYSDQDVESVRGQLQKPGWARMVGVTSKRDRENAEVFIMTDSASGKVLGMAVICTEPRQLTVVNIVGSIDLEKLSQLEGKMGIPTLQLDKSKPPAKKPDDEMEIM